MMADLNPERVPDLPGLGEVGERPAPHQDHRANNMPLTTVNSGTQRSLRDGSRRRSAPSAQEDTSFCKQVIRSRWRLSVYSLGDHWRRSGMAVSRGGLDRLRSWALPGMERADDLVPGQHQVFGLGSCLVPPPDSCLVIS